jgi:hypothetical protein
MSIYTNAVYGMRKRANYGANSADYDPEADYYFSIINDPNVSTADKLQAAYGLKQLGRGSDVPVRDIATGALCEIKSGVKSDYDSLRNRLHKKYTVLKGDAKARFNKFKNDLPGMYAEGKKQLGDFYDSNKSAIWAGGLGALGGGTIGASVAKNKLLGGLVGAGVGAGVSLGALRIAKYLGYDI